MLAGPNCARYLADFGADVIKVENPDGGDSLRNMAWRDPRDGEGLWWKVVNRNKRTIALDLKAPDDVAVLLRLVDDADVLVENFRPGTLERLGLGPDVLHAAQPAPRDHAGHRLRPDRAVREPPRLRHRSPRSMSGLSAISGEPGGQPLLPAIALTDEVTGLVAAFATMVALHSGVGQVVDVSLLESLFQMMGPLISLFELTGELQPRLGAGLPYTVPRGTYRCSDGKWVGLSASADTRRGAGAPACSASATIRASPRSPTGWRNRDALEAVMTRVVRGTARRPRCSTTFTAAHAAIGPVMDMADISRRPALRRARGDRRRRRHPDAGPRSPSSARPPAPSAGTAAASTPTATRSASPAG